MTKIALRDQRTLLSVALDGELRQWDILTEQCDYVIILPGPISTFLLNEAKNEMYLVCDMNLLCIVNIDVGFCLLR